MPKGGDFIPTVREIEKIIAADDKERLVNHPVCVSDRLDAYTQAVNEARLLMFGKGRISYDSPEIPYSYHALTLSFNSDEFDEREIEIFSNIIKNFTAMELIGSANCEPTVLLIMDGIYKEN